MHYFGYSSIYLLQAWPRVLLHTIEEALKRAKKAGRKPGRFYCGIILKSGKKGFAIYRGGKVIEQYSVLTGR